MDREGTRKDRTASAGRGETTNAGTQTEECAAPEEETPQEGGDKLGRWLLKTRKGAIAVASGRVPLEGTVASGARDGAKGDKRKEISPHRS